MSLEQFAQHIAAKVFHTELAAARALGYEEVAAVRSGFKAMDEAYLSVFAPDRAPVRTTFRPMVKR